MGAFATINLDGVALGSWVVVGVVTGLLTGCVRSGGYGTLGDMGLGLIGAVLGGFLYGLFATGTTGFWGSIGVAFLGACILIAVLWVVVYARAGT